MPAGDSTRRGRSAWPPLTPKAVPPRGNSGRGLLALEALVSALLLATIWSVVSLTTGTASAASTSQSVAAVSLSPANGPAGTMVTVSGSGFGHSLVQFTWDGSSTGMPTIQANGSGAFKTTITVPVASTAGSHAVVATSTTTLTPPPTTGKGGTNGNKPGASEASASSVFTTAAALATAATPVPTVAPTATPPATPAPTASPATATPTPTPTASPTPVAPTTGSFVTRCGTALCLDGTRWYLYGAAGNVASAPAAHVNTIRITNWLHEEPGNNPYDESRWSIVDGILAQAQSSGMHAILDLSTYRNFLYNTGLNPYTQDWGTMVTFVANRVNTITHVAYKNDPTIAIVGFAGEVDGITGNSDPRSPTTWQLNTFYQQVFAQWRAVDGTHLLEPGGLFHLNADSGIEWKTIFAAADVCSIHNYSQEDSANTATVAAYCASLGKPWITEEFGWSQSVDDATRAQNYQAMFTLQHSYGGAGVAFWFLGAQVLGVNGVTDTYDVNTSTPLTWNVVLANSP